MSGILKRLEEKIQKSVDEKINTLMPAIDQLHGDMIILNKNIEKLNDNFLKLVKLLESDKSG